MLSPAALEDWSNAYRGNQPTDPYMEPLTAPDDWWKDLAASEIFLTGGADELFINDIEEFATKLQEHFPGFLTKIVSVDSAHDSPLTSVILGKEGPDEQIFAFANLISKRA
ncbi:alpha/beta hydrolase fold protein [Penicillium sp. IBT 35674x]|nr:alpha/beta hydrolase fold protein [Penicillium sp. IBT 35674x]